MALYTVIERCKSLLARLAGGRAEESWVIPDRIAGRFIADPGFPRLISFPRTGSHWLRMLMELYFEKPSLVRAFYFRNAADFTCYHRHDQDLTERCSNVIYLYRNPLDTVYSQLVYYKESPSDPERIAYWATLYGRHLAKWLLDAGQGGQKKTVVRYEGLQSSPEGEFKKICSHLGLPFDVRKLERAGRLVSKKTLRRKTSHDPQVVNLTGAYEAGRSEFRQQQGEAVFRLLNSVDPQLGALF